MNRVDWTVVIIFSVVALLVFLIGVSLLGGWRYGGWGMMGPGMMGRWGFGTFGWIGMIFMWLIPISFLVLIVLGVVWVVQSLSKTTQPPIGRACPNCSKGIQTDWQNCPHCGTALK